MNHKNKREISRIKQSFSKDPPYLEGRKGENMKDDTNKNSLQNPKKQPPWRPRKSLLYYYFIVLMIVFLFNMFVMPVIEEKQIVVSTYSDFLEKLDKGEVVKVKISDTQILYEGKEDGESKIYKTGIVKDPELVQRL